MLATCSLQPCLAVLSSRAAPRAIPVPACSTTRLAVAPFTAPAPAPALRASPACMRAAPAAAVGTYRDAASAAGNVVVEVCADEAGVAAYLCSVVEAVAAKAIGARGVFTLAIPGGSVLKALAGLKNAAIDWSKVRLAFVNHKTVPNDEAATSSYAKARALFLDAVGVPATSVLALTGSDDAEAEAKAYEAALKKLAKEAGMELAPSGAPRFDLMLLGVGADGHVGSLYPGGRALDTSGAWVLPVVKSKPPASITLSLSTMNAARLVVVCLTGAKKAAATKLVLETPVPAGDFPAQLVQPDINPAVFLLDEAAAAELALVHGAHGGASAAPGVESVVSNSEAVAAQQSTADGSAGQLLPDGSVLYTF